MPNDRVRGRTRLRYVAATVVAAIGLVSVYFVGNLVVKAIALAALVLVVVFIVRGAVRVR